ncbi:MAG: T9SS type A sorting domain-containing protein [Bacteroidia bacterium]|nr:T9SS type A sorting domain-containing protein [Bacteroidia bacterium]MDW8416545.1 T9SS type A sorting domain-containing protein [Bacteroidia bacterium]
MVGDFVEVAFYWRGAPAHVPIGANFVLVGRPAAALAWREANLYTTGQWSAPHSTVYRPLYLTAREESSHAFRISMNLLTQNPPTGIPLSDTWSLIGTWRAPVMRFNDTLHLAWSMETGEIVLAPFVRAKSYFTYVAPLPLRLCPDFPRLHLIRQDEQLGIVGLEHFRSENLSIRWYRDGVLVHEGISCIPLIAGSYHAEVQHVCGSVTRTDTITWSSTSVSATVQGGWRIYPNPTNGLVWIESPKTCWAEIQLRDGVGRTIYMHSETFKSSQAQSINLPSLPTGLYYLNIRTEQETISLPISYAP